MRPPSANEPRAVPADPDSPACWCWKRFSWQLCCHGCAACLHALNSLLAIGAAGLSLLIAAVSLQRDIPVPPGLIERMAQPLIGPELVPSWQTAHFDLFGSLHLSRVRLRHRHSGEVVAAAEAVWIDPDLLGMLLDDPLPVDALRLTDLRIYAPGMLAPSGTAENLLTEGELHLQRRGDTLAILACQARWADWSVSLGGRLALPSPAAVDPVPGLRATPYARLSAALPRLLALRQNLPAVRQAHLAIGIDQHRQAPTRITAQLHGRSLEWSAAGLSVGDFRVTAPALRRALAAIQGSITGHGRDLRWAAHDLHAASASVRVPELSLPGDPFSGDWEWAIGNLSHPLGRIDSLAGTVRRQDGNYHAWLRLDAEPAQGRIHVNADPAARTAAVDVDGSIDIVHPWLTRHLPEAVLAEWPGAGWPVAIATSARFGPGWDFHTATFNVTVRGLRVSEATFAHINAAGTVTATGLSIDQARAWQSPEVAAEGSYWQDWTSRDFQMRIRGQAFPPLLDSILGHLRWWQNLWREAAIGEQPLVADVGVYGRWGSLPDTSHAVVCADVAGGYFRQLALDRLLVALRHHPGSVDLHTLLGRARSGSVNGSLYWELSTAEREQRMHFALSSDLAYPDLRAALRDSDDWADRFAPAEPPRLQVRGRLFPDDPDDIQRDVLLVTGHAPGAARVEGLPVNDVRFTARVDGPVLDISESTFTTCAGAGELRLRLDDRFAKAAPFTLYLNLKDADYPQVLTTLRQFWELTGDDIAAAGRVDLDADLSGQAGVLTSMRGEGKFAIHESELGQVRILGGLSRLLEVVGLRFTTLQLDTCNAVWILREGELKFPSILLSGPWINLDANGIVELPAIGLDFTVNAWVVRGLFGLVFRPVNAMLEFRLRGTWEDPEWSFSISPFRWLGG
jgi:hypothetical protein